MGEHETPTSSTVLLDSLEKRALHYVGFPAETQRWGRLLAMQSTGVVRHGVSGWRPIITFPLGSVEASPGMKDEDPEGEAYRSARCRPRIPFPSWIW